MATIAPFSESLDAQRLIAPHEPDRLPAMLFLAALIHGILIIGVTFNSTFGIPEADSISLEVTIVANPDQQIDRPDRAAYFAQASQTGGGNTPETVRPTAPRSSTMPVDNTGSEDGTGPTDALAHERSADEVIATMNDSDRSVAIDPRTEPQPEDITAIAMQAGSDVTLPLPEDERATLLIRDDNPRELIISADTRKSVVAAYLEAWKRRIEAVGASYLPELGDIGTISGSPVLLVTIASGGDLVDVEIRRSSGSPLLDLAALDILQRASPFNPFPPEVASEYEKVRFEYKWLFAERPVPAATSVN